MAAFNKFNSFVQALGTETHNLSSDVIKAVFSNTAPVNTNTVLANITQIANGGGYTGGAGGGMALDGVTWTNTSGTSKLVITDEVFTATGAAVGPFRYIVLYNDTAANDELIGWYDYGSNVTLADGESFTIDFDGTNGVFTLA